MDLSPDSQPVAGDATPRVTPMMEQYIEIKAANPGALLFYRMGDFYELFFGDAEIASRALGIALTKRGKHQGDDIPMCGVPIVRAEEYLHRLIALGHRVAVCDQMEDPAEARRRGGKAVVRRAVTRLVTPGTITEDGLLEPARANRLVAVARSKLGGGEAEFALAFTDISTGEFGVAGATGATLNREIARLDPSEIVIAEALEADPELAPLWREARGAVTATSRDLFDGASAERRHAAYFGVATLDGFGAFSRLETTAAAALVSYVERTQVGRRVPLEPPRREAAAVAMAIDPATRANLEIVRTLAGERAGSLLDAIDRTVTAPGSRLLCEWLSSPSTDRGAIVARQDAVASLVAASALRREIRQRLRSLPDLARALSRLSLDRGGPRDLAATADGVEAMAALADRLAAEAAKPDRLAAIAKALAAPDPAPAALIRGALADEVPLARRDGGFVRQGHDASLDEMRALRDESRQVIAAMQGRYQEETQLRQLRIKHNGVLGYFLEVPQQAGETLLQPPLREAFVHRQTMAGTMRFTTTELSAIEAKIASAAEQALATELAIFERLAGAAIQAGDTIRRACRAAAELDVLAALAELAEAEDWVRPQVEDSLAFAIEGGRHPVVERALKAGGQAFIANDCDLGGTDQGRIALLTGPNMAGKSTYLRQNAVIAILAQIGAFVPAKSARLGIVDALFSRVGAADDLARGRSTFMVEMVETAAILNQAGPRSLVILDEIGRGTATFDGLSIAWATIESLHEVNRCRALFATHYHELTQLATALPRLDTATMRVTEWQGDVVFLHEVVAGAADRSYGIQVAKLAGMPAKVVERARSILATLEAADRQAPKARLLDDLPLFAAAPRQAPSPQPPADPGAEAAIRILDGLDPNDLTPRQALEALFALKEARCSAK
jgi:DNA mismatch repair protein MutS